MDPKAREFRMTSQPPSLHGRAAENIAFIRDTLQRAGTFTAVPGRGGVVMGLIGLAGAWFASRQPDTASWLRVWMLTGAAGFVTAAVSMGVRARRAGVPVLAGPGRKFVFALAPSLLVGALLTVRLAGAGLATLLPGLWLLLYGTAIMASGAFSIRALGLMGGAFLALGGCALFLPAQGDVFMAAGFGGLNLGFGVWIWRNHGG